MTTYNHTAIAGNVVADPEVRYLAGDKSVASFALAINRRWKDSTGAPKESTTFVDCKAWGHLGELIGKHCTKGKNILVHGRLEQERWKDAKDGSNRSRLILIVTEMQFCGAPAEEEHHEHEPAPPPAATRQRAAPASQPADEPPF